MIKRLLYLGLVYTVLSHQAFAQASLSDEGLEGGKKLPGITAEELKNLEQTKFAQQLQKPNVLAFSDNELNAWAKKAKEAHKTAPVSRGDTNKIYDIVIQLGHYPRKSNRTGGQGKYVSEQEMAALVGVGILQQLGNLKNKKNPIRAILVGADDYNKNIKTKIFIALHTDAAANQCAVGPSVGYQKIGDATGMHAIALALAITLSKDAEKFMNDNYTKDEAGYYAFRDFNAEKFKGLLEMSELTCPVQERELLGKAALLSYNLALAVQFALRPPSI